MDKYYAGIGARDTPADVQMLMERFALRAATQNARYAKDTWILRSGHSPGADQAFGRGAGGQAEIYLPYPDFEGDVPLAARLVVRRPLDRAYDIMDAHSLGGHRVEGPYRHSLARDAHQILGPQLNRPADLAICWTPDGSLDGQSEASAGTGQTLRIATAYDVPVLNVARPAHRALVEAVAFGNEVPAALLNTATQGHSLA